MRDRFAHGTDPSVVGHFALDERVVKSQIQWFGRMREGVPSAVPPPRVTVFPARRSSPVTSSGEDIGPELALAFAPLHKRAFGLAIGTACGLVVFGLTWAHLAFDRVAAEGPFLWLLGHFFYGYAVTPGGAFVGLVWGLFVGFVAGWFVAFVRNFSIATAIFITRARAELHETRDFLDHI